MSALGGRGVTLPRPYTQGTFSKKLQDFEELIREITLQDVEATPEERRQRITENLRYDQFCESIRLLFGTDVRNQDLKAIYRKISTNPDAKVDWSELFGYFQGSGADDQELTVGEEVNVFSVPHRRRIGEAAGDKKRRDTSSCVRFIPQLDSYLSASQKGALTLWSCNKFHLQGCCDVQENSWVNGCDYLPALRKVAASTERSIVIWDNRAKGKNQTLFAIKPLEDSPQCLATIAGLRPTIQEDTMIYGDDQGYINIMRIAAKDLNLKNSKADKKFPQSVAIEPTKLSHPIHRRKVHDDWVLKVKWFPELRCFGSCSQSSTMSFVLEDINRIYDDGEVRGVSIQRGVNAFDFCARANILATGGADKVIRVWHPHIFTRPTGKLIGHLFTIVDIVCNEQDQHIISLSAARVVRIWDIHTLTSLQIFTDNEDRPGEKRINSMCFDNKHDRLVTASSVLDAWPLTRTVQDTMQVPHTHDRPINQILHNKELNHLVSVCSESVIRVWEVESGKQVSQVTEPHGPGVEVTCVAFHKSGYRMATGALDGSLKIWDFGSGQGIKHKRFGRANPEEDYSITGIVYFEMEGERVVLAAGWNNKIKLFLDSNENFDLTLVREFSDVYHWMELEQAFSPVDDPFNKTVPLPRIGDSPRTAPTEVFKKDFILSSHEVTCVTSDQDTRRLIAGCSNGNIVIWDIAKAAIEKIFVRPTSPPGSADVNDNMKLLNPNLISHQVNMVAILVHKVRRLDPAYIRRLAKAVVGSDDEEEEEKIAGLISKRSSRITSSLSTHSRPKGAIGLDRQDGHSLLDELTSKLEGIDAIDADPEEIQKRLEENPDGSGLEKEEEEQPLSQAASNPKNTGDASLSGKERKSRQQKSKRKSTASNVVDDKEDEKEVDLDPSANMIVETFEPILVSVHQDSFIRFWSNEGEFLREVSPMTRRQGSPVMCLCHDEDCSILITGDSKGYITMWDISDFLEDPRSEEPETITQMVCWRAHLAKIVSLSYVDTLDTIISGSADGSVRVWWGTKGRFVGFFSQHRPFFYPTSEETASTPVLPYDISEIPVALVKKKSAARERMQKEQKFEYPLVFDNERWEPFRRSAHFAKRTSKYEMGREEPTDKKFFAALIKPKPNKLHLESLKSGDTGTGAVYRALPVYKVTTPEKPKTPDIAYYNAEEDEQSYLYTGSTNTKARNGGFSIKGSKEQEKGKGKKKAGGQSGTAATPTTGTAAGTAASSQQPSSSQQSLSPRKR